MQPIFLRQAQAAARRCSALFRRFPRTSAPVLYALLLLPLYAGFLTGLQTYAPGDTLGFSYPALGAVRAFSLDSLLADPWSGRGFPWLATYGTLDPLAHALRLFLDEYLALAWLCYIYLVLSAWLFHLFLRHCGRSWTAAFLGGLVYMGGFFWTADGDYAFPLTLALFPALLLAATYLRRYPWRATALMALLVGLGWAGGHFNFVPLILVAITVFTAFLAWRSDAASWPRRLQPLLLYLVAAGCGMLIGLLKLIPALAYVGLSERAGGLSVAAAGRSAITLAALFTPLFPYMYVPGVEGEMGMLFFGAAGLALLLIGVLQRDRTLRPALLGFALILLIALPRSPLYALVQSLPFFSFLRTPRRWLFIGNACVAFIAAGTADGIQAGRLRYVRGVGSAFLLIACVAAVGSFLATVADVFFGEAIVRAGQRYFDAHLSAQTSGLPLSHYHRHIANLWQLGTGQLSPLAPRFMLPLLALFLTGWMLRAVVPKLSSRLPALALLTILSLLPPFFFYHPRVPAYLIRELRAVWSSAGLGDAPVLSVFPSIADQLERTGVVGDLPEERVAYQLGLLVPNTHALVGVRSIDFYQPIQPTRMARLLTALGSQHAPAPLPERLVLAKIPLEAKLRLFMDRLPLAQRLGVRYVSSVWELPAPLTPVTSLVFVPRLPPVHVYRVPDPRPSVYVASSVLVRAPQEDQAMAYLRDAPAKEPALVECAGCVAGTFRQPSARVTVVEERDTSVTLRVSAPAEVFLHVLRPRLPGWRAFVDDRPVRTAIGDGMFYAVRVPAGEHEVRLAITYGALLRGAVERLSCRCDPDQL